MTKNTKIEPKLEVASVGYVSQLPSDGYISSELSREALLVFLRAQKTVWVYPEASDQTHVFCVLPSPACRTGVLVTFDYEVDDEEDLENQTVVEVVFTNGFVAWFAFDAELGFHKARNTTYIEFSTMTVDLRHGRVVADKTHCASSSVSSTLYAEECVSISYRIDNVASEDDPDEEIEDEYVISELGRCNGFDVDGKTLVLLGQATSDPSVLVDSFQSMVEELAKKVV